MKQITSLNLKDAMKIVAYILKVASNDGGGPVAIAVTDAGGKLAAFVAMDGVMPASVIVAINKAHTAIVGQRDTIYWAKKSAGFDGRNLTDARFTCFPGGVVVLIAPGKIVVGAIGVSGRRGSKNDLKKKERKSAPAQDHELAVMGAEAFHGNK